VFEDVAEFLNVKVFQAEELSLQGGAHHVPFAIVLVLRVFLAVRVGANLQVGRQILP